MWLFGETDHKRRKKSIVDSEGLAGHTHAEVIPNAALAHARLYEKAQRNTTHVQRGPLCSKNTLRFVYHKTTTKHTPNPLL